MNTRNNLCLALAAFLALGSSLEADEASPAEIVMPPPAATGGEVPAAAGTPPRTAPVAPIPTAPARFDADGDGRISPAEKAAVRAALHGAATSLGLAVHLTEAKPDDLDAALVEVFRGRFDTTGDGGIDRAEYDAAKAEWKEYRHAHLASLGLNEQVAEVEAAYSAFEASVEGQDPRATAEARSRLETARLALQEAERAAGS